MVRVNELPVGARVRLRHQVTRREESGEHYSFPAGAVGTVTESTEDHLFVELDSTGEVIGWYSGWSDFHHPVRDLELIDEALEDVCQAIAEYRLGPVDSVTLDDEVAAELRIEYGAVSIMGVEVHVLPRVERDVTPAGEPYPRRSLFNEAVDDIYEALTAFPEVFYQESAITVDEEVADELRMTGTDGMMIWGRPVHMIPARSVEQCEDTYSGRHCTLERGHQGSHEHISVQHGTVWWRNGQAERVSAFIPDARCGSRRAGLECMRTPGHPGDHRGGDLVHPDGRIEPGVTWSRGRCEEWFTERGPDGVTHTSRLFRCEYGNAPHEAHRSHTFGGRQVTWRTEGDWYVQLRVDDEQWPWSGQLCVADTEHEWNGNHRDYFIRNLEVCHRCRGVRAVGGDRQMYEPEPGRFETE